MARDWQTVLNEHLNVVSQLDGHGEALDRMAEAIIACLRAEKRVYVFGNGGSAADAQHIATELLGRFKLNRRALPVIALTTDTSTLTAVGNDLGFESIFARQLEGLLQPGDIAWALSTSGNSPNVLHALRVARDRGATIIGFTGAAGDKFAELCTHVLKAPNTSSDRIQEVHELAYHYLCERIEAACGA